MSPVMHHLYPFQEKMGVVTDELPRSKERNIADCEGKMIISWLSGSG